MKRGSCYPLLVIGAVSLLLTGCLFKKTTVTARHFILSPLSTNEPALAATEKISVGIGVVKLPGYLLRDSLAVRNGDNEIEYLEDARWGERLDVSFQRTLAANLSRLLPSENVYSTDWLRSQVTLRVFVSVQQFEVDTQGRGTLVARWRISAPDNDTPLKSGVARVERTGASPRGNPGAIAATLSDLTGEFSRELAQVIRENSKQKP
jgi:uncharacterized lipoprotein YmbA